MYTEAEILVVDDQAFHCRSPKFGDQTANEPAQELHARRANVDPVGFLRGRDEYGAAGRRLPPDPISDLVMKPE
jgi:hypothetical protein